jgi:hypothetical protein
MKGWAKKRAHPTWLKKTGEKMLNWHFFKNLNEAL